QGRRREGQDGRGREDRRTRDREHGGGCGREDRLRREEGGQGDGQGREEGRRRDQERHHALIESTRPCEVCAKGGQTGCPSLLSVVARGLRAGVYFCRAAVESPRRESSLGGARPWPRRRVGLSSAPAARR